LEFKAGKKNKLANFKTSFLLVLAFLVFLLVNFVIFSSRAYKYSDQNINSNYPRIISKFNQNNSTEVTLFIAGDVMLGRTVMKKSYELKDFTYPFKIVADRMRESDIVFVNLENPVIEDCPFRETGLIFCTTPFMLDGLSFAGVDAVNLANNHILNYGKSGLDETLKHLESRNILATGVGDLVKLGRKETVFGFLGFDKSEQVNPKLTKSEIDLIKSSDSQVDILVVSAHWGIEYQDKALPRVRSLAKEIVENGADLIVGHHPHWVQDWEFVNGKPVFYSLGNFVFDQMWSEKTKKGLAVKLVYNDDGILTGYELLPTYMSSWAQPEFVE
jgi:poly-gamma-glutamate synthesis protein (capsule biosynthesis protein)